MKLAFFFIFFVANVFAKAVPPQPKHSPGGTAAPGPPGVPIDDHLIVLICLAVVYGLYVVYSKRKQVNL